MLTKDVEEKEGFTTSADAGDNLYHPIAFCRDELTSDIPCVQNISFIENFCVKTHIFAAKVHFLLDNAKVFHRFKLFRNIKRARLLVPPKYNQQKFRK